MDLSNWHSVPQWEPQMEICIVHSLHNDNLFYQLGTFNTCSTDYDNFISRVPVHSVFQSQHCVLGMGSYSKMGDNYFW